jgi:hypothetical protein
VVQNLYIPTQVRIKITIHIDYSYESVGSALARFERATLNGTRTVVLRFLKIITPVECVIPSYDGYICPPEEGELYWRRKWKKYPTVWSINLDSKKSTSMKSMIGCLKLLWDIG